MERKIKIYVEVLRNCFANTKVRFGKTRHGRVLSCLLSYRIFPPAAPAPRTNECQLWNGGFLSAADKLSQNRLAALESAPTSK